MTSSAAAGYAQRVDEYVSGRPEYPAALARRPAAGGHRHRACGKQVVPDAPARFAIVDRALSTSFIATLPQHEQDVVRSRSMAIVEDERPFRESTEFPDVTELHLFRKRG